MLTSFLNLICNRCDRRKRDGRRLGIAARRMQAEFLESRNLLSGGPLISEFVAVNNASLIDGFGETPDWIEIANPSNEPLILDKFYLTDDPENLAKWRFPGRLALESGQHLVVLASGRDTIDVAGYPHTNFKLSSSGEYLALSDVDGNVLTEFGSADNNYREMRVDISYGFVYDGQSFEGIPALLAAPTPGETNVATTHAGILPPVLFDRNGGLFDAPIEVTIRAPEQGLAIVFTTNGDAPTAEVGTIISPVGQSAAAEVTISVSSTTVVQAITTKPGWLSPLVTARTYIFANDIVQQEPNADDSDVCDKEYFPGVSVTCSIQGNVDAADFDNAELVDALYSLPTVSIVMDHDDLWSSERGIYANPLLSGPNSERTAFMEVFDGSQHFATNVSIAIMGRSSRYREKHAFRVNLVDEQGVGTTGRIVPLEALAKWDVGSVALRVESQDSASPQFSTATAPFTYARDAWVRTTLRQMGQSQAKSDYAHLYLNGSYWGLTTMTERVRHSFLQSRFGGDVTSADIITPGFERDPARPDVPQGSAVEWFALFEEVRKADFGTEAYFRITAKDTSGSTKPINAALLHVPSLIDLVIIETYSKGGDWIWNTIAANSDALGYRFFAWDNETNLQRSSNDWTGVDMWADEATGTPLELFYRFLAIPEFRVELGDAIYRHMFHDGALTPEVAVATWNGLAEELRPAVVAELARWGSDPKSVWEEGIREVAEEIIPESYELALLRFRERAWYPSIDPPIVNIRGGSVTAGQQVTLSSGDGKIYYTTDGSDPRAIYGEVGESAMLYAAPLTIDSTKNLKARILSESGEWSALEDLVYEVDVQDADAASLRITEIHYHPEPNGDAEFVEFTNVGSHTINLEDVRVEGGITFSFSGVETKYLEPGQQIVIVRDSVAFAEVYGNDISVAGQYSGKLSNGGDQIIVHSVVTGQIENITYHDDGDWPTLPDGNGFSLQLISNNLPGDRATSWRSSAVVGGTPGAPSYQIGDANLDGVFDSADLIQIFQLGRYEDDTSTDADWASGDWNGDGKFDSTDFVFAFQFSKFVV
ncbi:lamin tail domain-containing protein [Planctomycetota bacterium]